MKKLCLIAVLAILITTVCKAQNPGGVPISILPAFTDTLKPADVFPIVHGGATRRATIAQLATAIGASGPVGATGATGATGPTGDSQWMQDDSVIYLADTSQFVGIGTANPKYQLDVRNGFRSKSSNGEIVNKMLLLNVVPVTGIYREFADGDNLIAGNLNVSSAISNPNDTSELWFGYSDFNNKTHGLVIVPVDSSIELNSRKLLNISTNKLIAEADSITINSKEVAFGVDSSFILLAPEVTINNNILRLTEGGVVNSNIGKHQVLLGTDVYYTGNTALNGAAFNSNQLWHGASSIVNCYSDAMGYTTSVGPGQQFIYGHDNFKYMRDTTMGSAVIWDIIGMGENCSVLDNLVETLSDTISYSMLDNMFLRAFDSLNNNRIQGYKNWIKDVNMFGYSRITGNKLNTGTDIKIGNGTMQNSSIENFNMTNNGQHLWGFWLYNTQLSNLNDYSLDNVIYLNKGNVDLSTLASNISNTVFIGGLTKIDNLQMQGKLVFNNTDSATIYALPSPVPGETYYCTDCTPNDNSAGGVKVCYNGSLWRREW